MINHSKGIDLEITDFEYHDDRTYTGEVMPSQSSRCYTFIIFYHARRSRPSHELRRRESKKAKVEELSNNLSERRYELKAKEPVSEPSERASVDIVG